MKSFSALLVCLIAVITAQAQITSTSIKSAINFTSGTGSSQPVGNCIADFDSDGKIDIAICNSANNTVSVFRNKRNNTILDSTSFEAQMIINTGIVPIHANAGDLDNDGKPELLVSNYSSSTISVYRNISTSGSISFASKIDIATGANSGYMKIKDIDGDNKPDIINCNFGSNTFSVFRNTSTTGSLSFAARIDFAVSGSVATGSQMLTVDDFDGDSKNDVGVVYYNGYVGVFRNTSVSGSISFASSVNCTASNLAIGIASNDIDNDGKKDLAVTVYNSTKCYLFKNNSTSGNVIFGSSVQLTSGNSPHYVHLIDIDNDNKPDLVIANRASNTISIFRNIATSGTINTSSFDSKVDFSVGAAEPIGLAIGDINGDGKNDLVTSNNGSNSMSILQNQIAFTDIVQVQSDFLRNNLLYPVPFCDKINFSEEIGEVDNISIYDATGKLVLQQESPAQTSLSVGHLLCGVYFVNIITKHNNYFIRIVK